MSHSPATQIGGSDLFCDLALSRRLERAEGAASADFALARGRLSPDSGAEWILCHGADAVYDGIESPVTQTFGLGLFEDVTPSALDDLEDFFRKRNAPVFHEVSPFAGAELLQLLCTRNYRPVEVSNVLIRPLGDMMGSSRLPNSAEASEIRVRIIAPHETRLWSEISARGWAHEHPELRQFLLEMGSVAAARQHSECFLAEIGGMPGAAAGLNRHEGIALLAGSTTVPELRRRGLHAALMNERLRYAAHHQCDLAMITVQPGSESQRNAERNGFRIAYTRTKWKLWS